MPFGVDCVLLLLLLLLNILSIHISRFDKMLPCVSTDVGSMDRRTNTAGHSIHFEYG